MAESDVVLYRREGRVAIVTINRPAREERRSRTTCSTRCSTPSPAPTPTTSVRAVVVTGTGEFFSAGTDLSAGAGGYDADSPGFKPLRGGTRDVGGELALRIFGSRKPVIAAINGTAAGIGVTMVLPMDIRIGAEGSRFALPFTRRGIVPESCATWFLPRIVGIATAVDWAVTGRTFGADEALAAGLVRELLPAEQVLPRALEVATEIAERTSAVSVALTRQLLWRQLGEPHPLAPTGWSPRRCSRSGGWPTPRRAWPRSRRSARRSSRSPSPTCRSSIPGGRRSRSSHAQTPIWAPSCQTPIWARIVPTVGVGAQIGVSGSPVPLTQPGRCPGWPG